MNSILKNKAFWTGLSFATFLIFASAIVFHIYWINIFVIILGLVINKYASPILFPEQVKHKEIRAQRLEEFRARKNYKNR
ncbi:hypothetical protein PESHB5_01970 [Pediococcus parvulus]